MYSENYQESGQYNLIELILSIVSIIVSVLLLSYVYTILTGFIPLIYFNVLITIGFGIGIGLLVRVVLRLFRNRNAQYRLVITILAIVLAHYFQWTGFVNSTLMGRLPSFQEYLIGTDWIILSPIDFIHIIGEINTVGTWEINGIPFAGWMLTAVWIMEFVIITLAAIVIIRKRNVIPFSENLNKWYPKYTLVEAFKTMFSREKFEENFSDDPLGILQSMEGGSGIRHCRIHLYYLPKERNQYLSIDRVSLNHKGKATITIVVQNLRIDSADAKKVMEHYVSKRERFDVF